MVSEFTVSSLRNTPAFYYTVILLSANVLLLKSWKSYGFVEIYLELGRL